MRTQVTTIYDERGTNLRLFFGKPAESNVVAKQKGFVKTECFFEPGQIFGLDFRLSGGLRSLRILICRAPQENERVDSLGMVQPGAVVLFDVTGRTPCRMALAMFRRIAQTRELANLTDGEFEYLSMRVKARAAAGTGCSTPIWPPVRYES